METLATLAMDIDVRSADPAEAKLNSLRSSAKALEDQFGQTAAASKEQAASHGYTGTAAAQAEKTMRSLVEVYGVARDALGRFTKEDGSFRTSQEATALMLIRNAQATANLAKEQEKAATTTASYAAKVGALKAQLDPFAAVQLTLAQRTKLLDEAMAHGAITANQHADAISKVTRAAASDLLAIDALSKKHTETASTAKQLQYAGLNAGRQLADIGTQLGSGQGFGIVLIQQGPQILDIFAQLKAEGIGLKAALAGMAAELAPFAAVALPLAAVAGLLAVGVGRVLENEKAVRSFNGQLALNVDGLNYNAQALAETSKQLTAYGLSAKEASAGLSTFANAGVDPSKLKAFSIAAENLSEVSTAFKDVKAAQEATSNAFTDGYDAVAKLDHELNFLTASQREHIRVMFDAGKASEAQAEAFGAFANRVEDAAEKARGPWTESVRDLTSAWSGFTDALAQSDGVQTAVFGLEKLMGTVSAALRIAKGGQGDGGDVPDFMQSRGVGYRIFNTLNPWAYLSDAAKRDSFASSQKQGLAGLVGSGSGNDRDAKESIDRVNDILKKVDQPNALTRALERFHADLTAARSNGVVVTAAQEKQAEAALRKQFEPVTTQGAGKAAAAAARAQRTDARGDNVVEQAQTAELAAQISLTKNIEELARIKGAQIAQELETQRVRLDGQVHTKQISQHDADAALSSYRAAAGYKAQALALESANQIAQRDLQQRQEVLGYTQRVAQLQAAAAPTLEKAFAIQDKALADRQAYDRDALEDAVAQRVVSGQITLTKGKLLLVEQRIAQAADFEDQERQKRLAIFQRDLDLVQAGYANQVDILNSRKGLAQSSYQAAQIERQILNTTYDAERDRLSKIIANKDIDAKTLIESLGRLTTIEDIHRNELKALDLSDNMVTAYSDLVQALAGAAQSVVSGDFGGSISGAAGVAKQLAGLTSGGLSSALTSFASFAGPIGQAVSAVTGVLGAIGQASAAKAQKKLDDLNQSVEALRSDNKTSSGSIAGALEEANKAWNQDLEYTSAMVSSLRSIDSQIGSLANAVSRSISAGGLLSTSGLGLGTTGSTTGSLFGAIGGLLFGNSKTKTELLDQGLNFSASTYGNIVNGAGLSGSTYADLVSTKTKSFLGQAYSTKVTNSTVSGAVDPALLTQINGVIEALGKGVLSSADVFGAEAAKAAEAALGSAVVDLGKLSLKDLKPDEIASVLQATFDKVGDQLAAAGVPGLEDLADVGEGAFATLTRLAREYQVVDVSLASVGKTFGAVGVASLAARDALVDAVGGIDALVSQTSFFAQNFLTDAQQMAPVIKAVNDNLKAYGLSAESTRDQFASLVLAQDLTTEAGRNTYAALLAVAPAFDKVADAADKAAADTKARADYEAGIQDKIDDLTLSSSELQLKAHNKDLAAAAAYGDVAVALAKKYWDLQDATTAATAAADQAAKDAEAAAKNQDVATRAAANAADVYTKAMEEQAAAANASADALAGIVNKFVDLSDTLNKFADSLGLEGVTGAAAYGATKARLMSASGDQLPDAAKAFLEASKSVSATSAAYRQDVAFVQALARTQAGAAMGNANMFGSLFSGLPGFANGGSAIIGGNSGVDQNVLSINGQPQLMVGAGELLTVQPRGGASNDNSDVVALRQQVAALQATLDRIATSNDKMERTLTNVTEGGRAMQTEAAS